MTADDFTRFWAEAFPATVPLSYLFKRDYPSRWVRFHSLPGSRRYPENEADWARLLERQNTIIETLVGPQASLLLLTGYYISATSGKMEAPLTDTALHRFDYTPLPPVELPAIDPEHYQAGDQYRPLFAQVDWQRGAFDEVLRAVAEDAARCFWASPVQPCLIAPYDGGMDIITRDTVSREALKAQFPEWLSDRADGL